MDVFSFSETRKIFKWVTEKELRRVVWRKMNLFPTLWKRKREKMKKELNRER